MGRRRRRGKNKILRSIQDGFDLILSLTFRVFPFALAFGLIFGLGFGVRQALYADSNLAIKAVEITPEKMVGDHKIARIETRLLGKNIFKVDLGWVAREIEKDPEILRAEVIRQMPGTIEINVEERKAVALLRLNPRGKFGIISQDGVVVEILNGKHEGFTYIEAFSSEERRFRTGRKVKVRGILQAIRFLQLYSSHPFSLQEKISKVVLDKQGNVSIRLGEGPDIRLGRKPSTKLKALTKVESILRGQGRQSVDYIDLQYDQIVVRRKGS